MVGTIRYDAEVLQRIKDLFLENKGSIVIEQILKEEVKDPKSPIYQMDIPGYMGIERSIKPKLKERAFLKAHKSSKKEGVTGFSKEELKTLKKRGKLTSRKVTETEYLAMQDYIKKNPKTTREELAAKWKISDKTPYSAEKDFATKHGKLNWRRREGEKGAARKAYVTENAEKILKAMKENPTLTTGTKIRNHPDVNLTVKQFNSAMAALKSNKINPETNKSRFDISDDLQKKIKKIKGGTITTVEETLVKKKILDKQQVKDIFKSPRIASQEFFEKGKGKGTAFEHAFPRLLINKKVKGKYLFDKATRNALEITGTRTSPYLNFAKIKIDNLQKGLVNDFLADEITLDEYRKGINKLRERFRKATGGYEIGYIDFDENKNPKPVTNLKKATLPTGQWGGGTAQKITPFANAKYTAALLNNFLKDPENDIFSSLKRNMDVSEISSDTVDMYSKIASDYEKAKPHLYDTQKFAEFADNNLDNSVVKVVIKAEESVKPGDTPEIGDQRILKRWWGPEGREELGLRYKILNDATLNKNNICQLVFGKAGQQKLVFGKARGGLADGGCGDEMKQALDTQPEEVINKVSKQAVKPGESTQLRTMARQLLSKLPKGGRLGAILAGAGAVGAGTYAMMGDATADETGTTDQSTMNYNSITGTFDNTKTGDPETQQGILNWIADNPGKSGFAALPIMLGAGAALAKAGLPGGRYLTSWTAAIPAMMIPEKMWQYKEGMEAGEMITDPLNALWALGIETKADLTKAADWYKNLPEGQRTRLMSMQNLKDLKTTQGWKNLPSRLRTAILSPAAAGTDWAFQKRLKPATKKLTEAIIGSPGAQQAAKKGLGTLAKRAAIGLGAAALLPATVAAGLLSAPLTLGLGALSFGYAQYKDYRDGKAIVDSMLARGKITQADADNYMSLIKQGSLPFGLGNRLWGDDEMTLRGQTLDPTQQRQVLAGMEENIDVFQYGDPAQGIQGRQQVRALDRADDFDFFNEGGRVGLKAGTQISDVIDPDFDELGTDEWLFILKAAMAGDYGPIEYAEGGRVGMKGGGGMDRRGFLKWLASLAAGVAGGASGLFKTGGKKATEQVLKKGLEAGTKQFGNIEGMPAWFPRLISKIKEQGKLVEMADRDYVNGDIYTITLNGKKVTMEQNPLSGEIAIHWSPDGTNSNLTNRHIYYKPGETGFQRYGADPEHPFAADNLEVEVEKPTFEYLEPDLNSMGRDDTAPDSATVLDIFTEGDDVVQAMENLAGKSAKELEAGVEIQSNKDFKTHNQTDNQFPDATWDESENITPLADYQYKQTKDPTKKAGGGTVETGDIARRQSLVPPLAGPNPQGIMGLPSDVKQVKVG